MSEQENNAEVREQVKYLGREAERKINLGEQSFMDEATRMWIRGMVKESGVDFNSDIEGKADMSDQATTVVRKLGMERAVDVVRSIVVELCKRPGGGVYGKGNEVPEDSDELVGGYVDEYLSKLPEIGFVFDPKKYKGNGEPGGDWRTNTIYRVEAVFCVMNKLMWILDTEDSAEGQRRQTTEGMGKHLRERVMRGEEKAKGTVSEKAKRYEEGKIIRHLPKGGVETILLELTGK